jgi:hypothetical protein
VNATKQCATNSVIDVCRDRIRTSINVLGDAFGAGIVHHLSRAQLERIDAEVAAGRRMSIHEEIGTQFPL